jgi:hypothetical protein
MLETMISPTSRESASELVHGVLFYEDTASLSRTVAVFLADGLALGQPALIIATPEHRDAVLEELRVRHVDVDKVEAAGDLLCLDARQLLGTFMVNGMPEAASFKAHVPVALDHLHRGRTHCAIRAYGEMVDVLVQDGLTAAAIHLEGLWNQLAMMREFSLLCGYALGHFYKDAGMRDICAQHSHVIPADRALTPGAGTTTSIN